MAHRGPGGVYSCSGWYNGVVSIYSPIRLGPLLGCSGEMSFFRCISYCSLGFLVVDSLVGFLSWGENVLSFLRFSFFRIFSLGRWKYSGLMVVVGVVGFSMGVVFLLSFFSVFSCRKRQPFLLSECHHPFFWGVELVMCPTASFFFFPSSLFLFFHSFCVLSFRGSLGSYFFIY